MTNEMRTTTKLLSGSQQIHFYAIFFYCFCLPVWSTGTVLAIIVLLTSSIFSGALFKNRAKLANPLTFFLFGLYAVYLLGLSYTGDMNDGLKDVETKLSLFLFPLIFFTGPVLSTAQKKRAMECFIFACLFVTINALVQLCYSNTGFHLLVGIHSSYFCIYLGLGLFFLGQQLLPENRTQLTQSRKIIYLSLTLIFIGAILNLHAKMGIYTITFLLSVFYLGYSFQKRAFVKGILHTVLVLCLLGAVAKIIPSTNYIVYGNINIPNVTVSKEAPPNARLLIWKASLETAYKKIFFGHGTGDVHVELLKSYKANNFEAGVEWNFNPHNQYLQTSIALGLMGLFFLLGSFLTAIYFAWKEQHYFYLFFSLLFAMACLTESMLEVEKGVLFYAFFSSFFAADCVSRDRCE